MTLGEHQEAFAKDFFKLLQKIFELGYKVRIGEVQRTQEQQEIYIRTGKSKTMNSMHLKKCAVDLFITLDGKIVYPKEIGEYWQSLDPLNQAGMFWTTFSDMPHYERHC